MGKRGKKDEVRVWLMQIVTLLIVAIILFGVVALFYPEAIAKEVRIGEMVLKGSSVVLAFAVILLLALRRIWPDVARILLKCSDVAGKLMSKFFTGLLRLFRQD